MNIPTKINSLAPDFTLPDAGGVIRKLSDFRGKWVVLYFYPKDETPICTKEACAFRDAYADFAELGAVVIGVSSDTPDSHTQFAQKRQLPFLLLSDTSGEIQKRYGVSKILGIIPGRKTFLIDPSGKIHDIVSSPLRADIHIQSMLAHLRRHKNS